MKHRASLTLEAVIVVPAVLLCMFAVLFAFQVLYQYVVLEYAANFAATRGAMYWDYKSYDFNKGTTGEKADVYQGIKALFGDNSSTNSRTKEIKKNAEKTVRSLTVLGKTPKVSVDYKNSLLGSKVTVSIKQEINVPFKAFITYLTKDGFKLEASSSANLYDADEFIRNSDYVYELVSASKIVKKISEGFKKVKNTLNSYF